MHDICDRLIGYLKRFLMFRGYFSWVICLNSWHGLLRDAYECVCGDGRCDLLILYYQGGGGRFTFRVGKDFIDEVAVEGGTDFVKRGLSDLCVCSPDLSYLINVAYDMNKRVGGLLRSFVDAGLEMTFGKEFDGCSESFDCSGGRCGYELVCAWGDYVFRVGGELERTLSVASGFDLYSGDRRIAGVDVNLGSVGVGSAGAGSLCDFYVVMRGKVERNVRKIKSKLDEVMNYVVLYKLFP